MLFGRPLKIATTMKPMIIAMMFPKSLPRRLVNIPHRKTPRSDPYVYPNIPSTIGMIRTFGCTMTRYEVVDATIIIRIENQTVAQRTARRLCSAVDRGLMYGSCPIARETCGQRVYRCAERAHGGSENSRDQQPAQADWHLVRMKWQNVSLGVLGNVGSGCA